MLKIIAVLLLPLLLATFAHADGGVDLAQQRIRIMLKTEPPTLNSLLATDNISGLILTHIMEGLLQYNERNELVPGVAERWQLRADGATFWLRRDARWSDGKPVTAHDFRIRLAAGSGAGHRESLRIYHGADKKCHAHQ
jgi:oligopeptide transport system substrate-binding protein